VEGADAALIEHLRNRNRLDVSHFLPLVIDGR
jgi:hypothetical protein